VAAGGVFVLLAAPGWMSFLVSWKHLSTGYDAPGATTLPLAQFIGFFDDIFYRQAVTDEIIVAPALNFVFLLGALWWLTAPRLWRGDRTGLALALAALPPFALAFGVVPKAVIVRIPFVGNIIHVGNTFSCVLLILVAVLAGCGLRDALDRLKKSGWGRQLGWVLAVFAGLLAVYFLRTGQWPKSPFFTGYAPALVTAAVALPLGLRWGARAATPGALCVVLGLALPLLLWRHSQFGATRFSPYAFVPAQRHDLHAASAGAQLLDQQRREPGRVTGWGNTLYPSYNTALHWEGLYGVDALRSRPYEELARQLGLRRVWDWDWANTVADAPRLIRAHNLLNVTHWVADHMEPPQKYPGLDLLASLDLDVYASPGAWPRAFFTDRLATYATVADFAATVLAGDGRPFAAVQQGETGGSAGLAADLAGRTVRAATGYRLTSNNTSFVVDATGPGVAVLTETYLAEDFQVMVDGKPAPYFRVNHAFKGVAIGAAGRHEITFAYWPQHFTLALWLGAAGLVLLVAGFGWLWRGAPPTTADAAA
jgi:hypothetical protein